MRRSDLDFARAYYALRHLLPEQAEAVKAEAAELYRRVPLACRLPEKGGMPPDVARRGTRCVADAYRQQREHWHGRIARSSSAGAKEEIARSIDDHLRLQGELQRAGFLSPDASVDGVFGSITRGAIVALQEAESLPADGFMSAATAERLRRRVGSAGDGVPADIEGALARSAALIERYAACLADLDGHERKREAIEQDRKDRSLKLSRLREKQAVAERLAAQPVGKDLKGFLSRFADEARKATPATEPAVLDRLHDDWAKWLTRMEDGVALVEALTPANRFLFEGAPDDVVFLFSTGPGSTVTRGLYGNLLFEREGAPACLLHGAAGDRSVLRPVKEKARALGGRLKGPLPRCSPDSLGRHDVLIVQRDLLKQEPARFAVTLAGEVQAGRYASMALLSETDLKRAAEAEIAARRFLRGRLEAEDTQGFGIVAVENGSSVACAVASAGETLPDPLLKALGERYADEAGGAPSVLSSSANDAFLSARRGRCGAVYANGRDLATLESGLKRERVAHRLLAAWLPVEQFRNPPSTSERGPVPPESPNEQRTQPEEPPPLPPAPTFAERRLAFVVGVNDYPNLSQDAQLQRAAADADAVGDALAGLGFQVTRLTRDATQETLLRRFEAFVQLIEPGDMVLFFFAGHGVALGESNYLIPADIPAFGGNEMLLRSRALAETDLTEAIQAKNARVTVMVIDACRNNPFPKAGTRSIGLSRGLNVKQPAEGVFAMYSAGRNQLALDRLSDAGDPSPNSVFTRVFVEQIRKPGLNLSEFGDTVREEVTALAKGVGHAQVPAVYNQLLGSRRFFLAGPATRVSR